MIRGFLLVVLTFGMIVAGSAAALADDGSTTLIDASPGVDAVVIRPPEEISLSFRDPIAVVDVRLFNNDTLISSSSARVDDRLAVVPVESAGPGSYLVDWKGTDAEGDAIAGAYVFLVDPRGTNSIAVEREVAGASGALGGLRAIAAAIAAIGTVALFVGAVGWVGRTPPRPSRSMIGGGALAAGIASLAAGTTYGVPSDGSLLNIVSSTTVAAAVASSPGRAWLTVALLMGVMPFILVLGRSVGSRWVAWAAVAVGLLAGLWVAVGLGWLVRLPWPLMGAALAIAAALWSSIEAGRLVAAGVSLAVGLAVAVPIVSGIRGSGAGSAVQAGEILIETSLDPARSGANELHVYGFDTSGRGSEVEDASVLAYHRAMDVGPLHLPVLRAGPNHFLSYRAVLPLSGDWTLNVTVATRETGAESVSMEMHLR